MMCSTACGSSICQRFTWRHEILQIAVQHSMVGRRHTAKHTATFCSAFHTFVWETQKTLGKWAMPALRQTSWQSSLAAVAVGQFVFPFLIRVILFRLIKAMVYSLYMYTCSIQKKRMQLQFENLFYKNNQREAFPRRDHAYWEMQTQYKSTAFAPQLCAGPLPSAACASSSF